MFGIPARPLEQLLGRRTGALTNFFANGDSLRQGINGLVQHALLIGGGRHGYPLLIVLLESGHALDGGCRRVELLVRDIRRLLGETGRGRLDLSVRCRDERNPAAISRLAAVDRIKIRIIYLLCTLHPRQSGGKTASDGNRVLCGAATSGSVAAC